MNGFVKMGRCLFFVLLLISSTVSKGQIYKYIGLEDGLNNQKIYHIQKDQRGYMWFLTQEGIDRYDGKHIKHYNFSDDSMKLDSRIALNWLYMDSENVLWVIGQKGRIFKYDIVVTKADGTETTVATDGTWANDASEKFADFDPIEAKKVKLVIKDAGSDNAGKHGTIAELNLYAAYTESIQYLCKIQE